MQHEPAPPTIGYLIADLTRLFGRVFDRRAAHLGLTRAQWRALKRIHDRQGLSQVELADELDMEPIAVGRVVDRLQKAGFVERRADPDDRRRWRLYLRPQAMQVMGDIAEVSATLRAEALEGLPADEIEAMLRALLHLRENLIRLDRDSRAGQPSSQRY